MAAAKQLGRRSLSSRRQEGSGHGGWAAGAPTEALVAEVMDLKIHTLFDYAQYFLDFTHSKEIIILFKAEPLYCCHNTRYFHYILIIIFLSNIITEYIPVVLCFKNTDLNSR